MVRMLGVPEGFEEFVVAPNATNILWRARTLALVNSHRLAFSRSRRDGFKHELMLPAVTEVILVNHSVLRFQQDILQPYFPLVDAPDAELGI